MATAPAEEQMEAKPETKPAPEPETIEIKAITHAQVVVPTIMTGLMRISWPKTAVA